MYLVTSCSAKKFRDDQRILKILVEKEQQAHKNIGDPAILMGLYDAQKEELRVRDVIEGTTSTGGLFTCEQEEDPFDPVAALLGTGTQPSVHSTRSMPSLYASDYDYLKSALTRIKGDSLDFELRMWDHEQRIQLTASNALQNVTDTLPREARPKHNIFDLTAQPKVMMAGIRAARATEETWPQMHYLWPLHPLMDWATDKVRASFRRLEAPVIALPSANAQAISYIISISYPNRKGRTVFQEWCVVRATGGVFHVERLQGSPEFAALQSSRLANAGCEQQAIEVARRMLPDAVEQAAEFVRAERDRFVSELDPKLQSHLADLKHLKARHETHVGERFMAEDQLTTGRRVHALRRVEEKFNTYRQWIHDTMHIEETPYMQVVAVLAGG